MQWTPVTVFPSSELVWDVTQAHLKRGDLFGSIFKIAFRGRYRPGSQGTPDADFMVAVTAAAIAGSACPDAVVFDFLELDYQWGNGLLAVFNVVGDRDREFPVAPVVAAGPHAFPGIASLAGGKIEGWLFHDIDRATERATDLVLERARAIG